MDIVLVLLLLLSLVVAFMVVCVMSERSDKE
jgi:hypothetical protein